MSFKNKFSSEDSEMFIETCYFFFAKKYLIKYNTIPFLALIVKQKIFIIFFLIILWLNY